MDDALHATRAALEEGIVPGGGIAYLRAVDSGLDLSRLRPNSDEVIGANIVFKAIEEPIRQILLNAGEEPSVIIAEIRRDKDWKSLNASTGYNALTGEFGNMYEMGVIDPTKVTRVALENAASVAGLLITTETVIVEKPVDNANLLWNDEANFEFYRGSPSQGALSRLCTRDDNVVCEPDQCFCESLSWIRTGRCVHGHD